MKLREMAYQSSILPVSRMEVPVISVGNLSMGGTGKTPLVIYLAGLMKKLSLKPAVISRGYKGRASSKVNLVSDGKTIFLSAEDCGDEPRLMAEKLPGIPVLTGKKRKYPCRYAIDKLGCNSLILDDAFQHLGVKRDLDLVLFNADSLAQDMRVFPGGELREGFSALKRCDAIVFTGEVDKYLAEIKSFMQKLEDLAISRPHFSARPGVPLICNFKTGQPEGELKGRVAAFCGIGNPERFRQYLVGTGLELAGFRAFPDHHRYKDGDIAALENMAEKHGADYLLTTEKDRVKLHGRKFNLHIKYLSFELELGEGFDSLVRQRLELFRQS